MNTSIHPASLQVTVTVSHDLNSVLTLVVVVRDPGVRRIGGQVLAEVQWSVVQRVMAKLDEHPAGEYLRSFPGYLKWWSPILET